MNNHKIYVNHIPTTFDQSKIEDLFADCGKITEIHYPKDKNTEQAKGYAFISFDSPEAAEKALEKNDEKMEDEEELLVVEIAIEKPPKKDRKEKRPRKNKRK